MNKTTRNRIEKIANEIADHKGKLEDLRSEIEDFKDQEREKYDNMSENLQGSEKGEAISQAADTLENAYSAMESLKEKNLDETIKQLTQPVLGICVGMQLLCDHSEENNTTGLGIMDLKVKKFISEEKEFSYSDYLHPIRGGSAYHLPP